MDGRGKSARPQVVDLKLRSGAAIGSYASDGVFTRRQPRSRPAFLLLCCLASGDTLVD